MGKEQRGFGLAGESANETIHEAAMAAENAGFETFWLSQPASGSTLAKLHDVANITDRIRLGVGAIPLTRESPEEIADQIRNLPLPSNRLRLGLGSGTGVGSLDRLRRGVESLRTLADVEVVVAPLGPTMCEVAGEAADAVLLNWLTPSYAAKSAEWVRKGATRAGRDVPVITCYVRCALGSASLARLETECARYGSFPHYAAHFERQGVQPLETAILATSSIAMQKQIEVYESVLDQVVVRAITASTQEEVLQLIESSRP
ncbi:MAG: LLM class flavin-dependent oxidoreductase [Thermomicrobiales bacterium]